jgi:hypothetical protein
VTDELTKYTPDTYFSLLLGFSLLWTFPLLVTSDLPLWYFSHSIHFCSRFVFFKQVKHNEIRKCKLGSSSSFIETTIQSSQKTQTRKRYLWVFSARIFKIIFAVLNLNFTIYFSYFTHRPLYFFFFFLLDSPIWAWASSFRRGFMITHFRHTTVGRTPLDEEPARRRDLYLTTHNTHNRQTSMP